MPFVIKVVYKSEEKSVPDLCLLNELQELNFYLMHLKMLQFTNDMKFEDFETT